MVLGALRSDEYVDHLRMIYNTRLTEIAYPYKLGYRMTLSAGASTLRSIEIAFGRVTAAHAYF